MGRAHRELGMKGKGRRPVSVVEGNPFGTTEEGGSSSGEGYTCRICFEESADFSQLISPCQCKGIVTVPIPRTDMILCHSHASYAAYRPLVHNLWPPRAISCSLVSGAVRVLLGLQQFEGFA